MDLFISTSVYFLETKTLDKVPFLTSFPSIQCSMSLATSDLIKFISLMKDNITFMSALRLRTWLTRSYLGKLSCFFFEGSLLLLRFLLSLSSSSVASLSLLEEDELNF